MVPKPPETHIFGTWKNGWLEYDPAPFLGCKRPIFRCENAVSFRLEPEVCGAYCMYGWIPMDGIQWRKVDERYK